MAEPTLLNEGSVQVTRQRLVVEGREYPLRDITAVQIGTLPLPRFLVALGLLLGVGTGMWGQAAGSLLVALFGLALLGVVGVIWWRCQHTYTLILGAPTGDQPVLTSRNRQFVDRVAQVIDGILVGRGRR
jgi:hypothetical protein